MNASLVEATGARYVCGQERNVVQAAEAEGGYDLIFECSGFSPLVFDGMRALAKNGVLVLSSITGGDRQVEVPSDVVNQSLRAREQADAGHGERRPRRLRAGRA